VTDLPGESFDPAGAPSSAGAALRNAREEAGLSIDAVAQQLKLAPRQVQAIEDDDYARLPGRTFVRGFVRNYARYLNLDPDTVVGLLPGADVAPALERPTITPSGRPMGELPADAPGRRGSARWAIPLLLLTIVVAAGVYEFRRSQLETQRLMSGDAATPSGAAATGTAQLSNPIAGNASGPGPNAPVAGGTATPGAGDATAPPTGTAAPAADEASAAAATDAPGPGNATSAANAGAPAAPSGGGAAAPGATGAAASGAPGNASAVGAVLVLTFKGGSSWVQVKDRNGNILIGQTAQPGTTAQVSGTPPLDVVLGNARAVSATYRGQPVDFAGQVRGNVARFSLK